ncbi:MAG: adenylyltransferase/cytidyltransferase family protein [Flavobacteriia bacterium]|nr:adenylyltransferase/cytidyltransferase family protein [Flavobacteriia bacterium]
MNQQINLLLNKIVDQNKAAEIIQLWKREGQKIVFTNGCFDILHKGHIMYLSKSADLGDKLVIAVNTDVSVKQQNKGENRPINKQEDRLLLLSALQFVSLVFLFNESTPLQAILELKPDVLVKGADYDENQREKTEKNYIVGSNEILSMGGEVKTIRLEEGYSSTSIINRFNSK